MQQEKRPIARGTRIREASQSRRERQKEELRAGILRAAGEEFLEHGYENFSLRRVAERIGYSATTIYLYFHNKDELLLATVQDGFRAFDTTIEAAAAAETDPLRRIELLGRTYIQFGLEQPALYRLMFMQRSDLMFMPRLLGSGTPPEDWETATQAPHHRVVAQELLVAAVTEAMAAARINPDNPLLTADALWAAVHGIVALANSPLMPTDHAKQVAEHLLRVLIQGLRCPPRME